jgi:hypothetical protein
MGAIMAWYLGTIVMAGSYYYHSAIIDIIDFTSGDRSFSNI